MSREGLLNKNEYYKNSQGSSIPNKIYSGYIQLKKS